MAMIMRDSFADYLLEPGKPIQFAEALFWIVYDDRRASLGRMRGECAGSAPARNQDSASTGELTLPRFMSRTHRVRKCGAAVDYALARPPPTLWVQSPEMIVGQLTFFLIRSTVPYTRQGHKRCVTEFVRTWL